MYRNAVQLADKRIPFKMVKCNSKILHCFIICSVWFETYVLCEALEQNNIKVKSGNFGHQVNSDSDLVRFIS